ncbi:MAG: AsmA family protein [Elusimicrobia bacterium]|nr:AsmA family protein [Elusimicrobiota bacterium]
MRKKRGLKHVVRSSFWAFLLSGVVILTVFPIVVTRVIGVDAIVSWALAEISEALHRQIFVGQAHLSLLGKIDFQDVKISEHPTFKEGTFLEGERLVLEPKFVHLLLGRIVIDELKLEGAKVRFVRNTKGRWNIQHIARRPQGPKVLNLEPSSNGAGGYLDIDDIELSRTNFILKDELGKIPTVTLNNVVLRAKGFSPNASFSTFLSLEAQVERPSTGAVAAVGQNQWVELLSRSTMAVHLNGWVNAGGWNLDQANASLKEFKIEAATWKISAEGTLESAFRPRAGLKISAGFDKFEMGHGSAPLTMDGQGQVLLNLGMDKHMFSVDVTATELGVFWGDRFQKKARVPFEMSVDGRWTLPAPLPKPPGSSGPVVASTATLAYHLNGKVEFEFAEAAKGGIKNLAFIFRRQVLLKPDIEDQKEDDDEAFPEWPSAQAPWPVPVSSELSDWELTVSSLTCYPQGLPSLFPFMDKNFRITRGLIKADELRLWGKGGSWNLSGQNLRLQGARLNNPKDKISSVELGVERLAFRSPRPFWELDVAGALTLARADTTFLACRELVGRADLRGISNQRDPPIDGEIHVHLSSGVLRGVPDLVQRAPFMKFLVYPLRITEDLNDWGILKLDGQDFKSIPMESMQSDYYFERGRMNLEKITVRGPLSNVQVSGMVNFPQDQINLLVAISMPREKIRWPLADAFMDEHGNPYLHIKIKGPLKKPPVYPVLSHKKDMLSEISEQLTALRQTTRQLLDKIFHRKNGAQ